jgi:hypothetical protein
MGNDRKPLGLLALLAVCAILASAVIAVNADAARGAGKGGGKHGGGTPPTYTGTCAAAPNPVTLWDYVTISGSGAAPKDAIGYTLVDAGGTSAGWVIADDTGNFVLSYQTYVSGTTTATFGGVASCSFQVV